MALNRPNDFVQSQQQNAIKQHIVYDGSNRMSITYEAPAAAKDGAPCLVTTYQYDGTSNRISGMKESEGVWSAAWDF